MAAAPLAPMGVREILETGLRIYARRFRTFAAISLVVYTPYAFALAIVTGAIREAFSALPSLGGDTSFWSLSSSGAPDHVGVAASFGLGLHAQLTGGGGADVSGALGTALVALVGAVLFLSVVYPLGSAALVVNIGASYLGEELTAVQSFRRMLPRLGRLLSAQFLVTLMVGLGVLLVLFPALLFSLWYMVVPAVVLLEEVSASGALKRSRQLMRGNLWKGFVLGVLSSVLSIAIGAILASIVRRFPYPSEFARDFATHFVQGLCLPISVSSMVLFYYDLRVRKDSFTLESLATNLHSLSPDDTAAWTRDAGD